MFNCPSSIIILLTTIFLTGSSIEIVSQREGCSQETVMLADCLLPHQNYIKSSLIDVTGREILNQTFMLEFVDFTRSLSTCIDARPACDRIRHYKYFADALSYVGETFYDPMVFECLEKIEEPLRQCFDESRFEYRTFISLHDFFPASLVDILSCLTGLLTGDNGVCAKRTTDKIQCAFLGIRGIAKNYYDFQRGNMKLVKFDKTKLMTRKLKNVSCE